VTDAFIAFDREFRYTYVNPAAAKLTQKTPEELLGKTLWEVFPDTIGSRFESEYRRALFEQVKVEFEEYYQPYDMWVEVHAYPSSSGLSLYYRDISDRKQAEEALRKSEELKGRILESSQDCIKVLSLDGRLLYVNTGGLALLEIDNPTAFLDTNWLDYWQGEDRQSAEAAIAVAKAGNVGQFQGFCPTAKGKPKWWDVIITPIRDASGQVAQLLSISRDITKQKQAEAEREQLLEQERVAREEAQAANRIKDEFLAVLSHELRSPLNPILGWTKLLRSRKFDAQATDRALETIERNAKLQTQLIEDLLDVSRILQGKMALNIAPIDLTTTIEAAIETVRLAARAKNIQIQTQFAPNVGLVCGDANRLQQVVWNLLSNAVKFTPSGGRIEVSLMGVASGIGSRESGVGDKGDKEAIPAASHQPLSNYQLPTTNYQLPITNYAKIQVSDTGKGINSDFLPYVFDYFRQEDGTTTRKFGGLGLGLAIVRHITELHGGTVKAESLGEGKGATFTVSLPLLQDENPEISDRSATSSFLACRLQGIRVLVVDDEADMLNLAQFVLEQYGAEVQVAASAAEAMLIFDRFVPNVLISDIGMPDLDGYMLMQQVRQRSPQAGGQVSAIALTAYAGECDRQLARQAGFQLHLPKPVEPEQLVQAIAVLCDR
jgi:PAS domain S-box-containing protein